MTGVGWCEGVTDKEGGAATAVAAGGRRAGGGGGLCAAPVCRHSGPRRTSRRQGGREAGSTPGPACNSTSRLPHWSRLALDSELPAPLALLLEEAQFEGLRGPERHTEFNGLRHKEQRGL
ncbi:hypothetical protein EYF80_031863 [Liparis tanakae]|uniref:Uncharacterized protein n=1 Tax=Liparis tanakae TaxID=230148 RepID=A0A4Z2GWC1_9TELE|nr:hypothetical protein EYF80_031863 [Liparis tanakae]